MASSLLTAFVLLVSEAPSQFVLELARGDLWQFQVIGFCGEVNKRIGRLFGQCRPAADPAHHAGYSLSLRA